MRDLFHKIYDDAHDFVKTKLVAKMVLLESMYIRQSIDLLEGLLLDDNNGMYLQISKNAIYNLSLNFIHYKINFAFLLQLLKST